MLFIATVYVVASINDSDRQNDTGGLIITAQKLSQKPQAYFSLDNPDAYVLQAIANPGEVVHVGNWEDTQIDDIAREEGAGTTVNIEFNDHYYNIGIGSVTPNPPAELRLIPVLIIGWILWTVSLIVAIVIHFNKKRPI